MIEARTKIGITFADNSQIISLPISFFCGNSYPYYDFVNKSSGIYYTRAEYLFQNGLPGTLNYFQVVKSGANYFYNIFDLDNCGYTSIVNNIKAGKKYVIKQINIVFNSLPSYAGFFPIKNVGTISCINGTSTVNMISFLKFITPEMNRKIVPYPYSEKKHIPNRYTIPCEILADIEHGVTFEFDIRKDGLEPDAWDIDISFLLTENKQK